MTFDYILNWRLLSGSHDFPGPEGGTCINEAAIVAAGFEYRAVSSARDCPPCFSRPVATYAIRLNDAMSDADRQDLLMPFVMRLSGTADTPEIEKARVTFMAMATVQRILPPLLRLRGKETKALQCERASDLVEAQKAASAAASAAASPAATAAAASASAATTAAATATTATTAAAAYASAAAYAAYAAAYAADADDARREVWKIAVGILDEAIKLGNQAPALDLAVVAERFERTKATNGPFADAAMAAAFVAQRNG